MLIDEYNPQLNVVTVNATYLLIGSYSLSHSKT